MVSTEAFIFLGGKFIVRLREARMVCSKGFFKKRKTWNCEKNVNWLKIDCLSKYKEIKQFLHKTDRLVVEWCRTTALSPSPTMPCQASFSFHKRQARFLLAGGHVVYTGLDLEPD